MADNTREIVLDTLLSIERGEAFSHQLMKAVLDKYNYMEERDKSFMKRLTEGTIERQLELDYYLNSLSSVPVKKMKPLIRCLMRMSVYQLLYMDNVPDSAVCNEACKLAQKRKFSNLKGFVNGVLRSIARQKENLPLPDPQKNQMQYFSVKYSMPEWIVEMWLKQYSTETVERILQGLLAIHPVSLRFRVDLTDAERAEIVAKIQASGVQMKQSPYLPYVYELENVEGIANLYGYGEGLFVVQDASSALAVCAAGIKAGDKVMDICAAPGGKSMLAAESTGPDGSVLSRDISDKKIAIIEENRARMGYENMTIEVHDATVTDPDKFGFADVLLADVPCSGLGVMGKKRDIKYHVTKDQLTSIVELQKQIIEASWQYVKQGGVLLYSTCTIHAKENEEMCKWIVENFPFSLEEEKQFLPGIDDTDGFYYARLRRK